MQGWGYPMLWYQPFLCGLYTRLLASSIRCPRSALSLSQFQLPAIGQADVS